MKIKSLYISAQEKDAGTIFVSMGIMEILKRNIDRVAFFRPIIFKKDKKDNDINFILKRYNIDMDYEDSYGFDIDYVEKMISQHRTNELINQLIQKFKKLEDKYDFVLCEGVRRSFLTTTINYDLNIKIAQNFGSAVINIINAKNSTVLDVYENMLIEKENLKSEGCVHFATFINRLDSEQHKSLQSTLKSGDKNCYLLKEVAELDMLTIQDVIEGLGAKSVSMREKDHTRIIRDVKVAALTLDNFLQYLEEDDLVIVPADRSDIILGLFGSLYSNNYPNVSGIIFPFSMKAHPNIKKLLDGLDGFNIPIISIDTNTYETARNISKVSARIRVTSERKIALVLGMFNANTDIESIERRITSTYSTTMTPVMFEYKLFEMARSNKKRIVLPESKDERILRAAEIIIRRGVADVILLGNEKEVRENYMRLGVDLSGATIIDYKNSKLLDEFTDAFFKQREAKGLSKLAARDAMQHVNYFATMMVHLGYADGMVSGAIHSTGETIRPALQIIKTTPDTSIVSSVFFMCLKTKVLVYGDCAVNQDPDAEALAQIAYSSSKTAEAFGIDPKVAMLSYSTGESGTGADVDKVKEATGIFKSLHPDILVEGPIQYDAAIDADVAASKLPNSKVAGKATVFIFPDLNTGNNTYKAVQRSSGAVAIGPILQGLNKPINDLSRGCSVDDIVNTVAITAIQAGQVK
ncbi:phosphate acetyltransferase [Candidatus Sulfurimonas marisnigri]|uniref:Phosphate acetyltransferase n=1 Tax=Candidatus Sulfurimonas marisnigri TaxID=2740405 RepID=A0A7S7M0R5_9BACT|nr:phosphate acetyltransferase [Candidatus Sulfurimonas marisnigri]QOY54124.1 phosphate acetyltransferase [Candidatus Sulfurimonas marisnigri]